MSGRRTKLRERRGATYLTKLSSAMSRGLRCTLVMIKDQRQGLPSQRGDARAGDAAAVGDSAGERGGITAAAACVRLEDVRGRISATPTKRDGPGRMVATGEGGGDRNEDSLDSERLGIAAVRYAEGDLKGEALGRIWLELEGGFRLGVDGGER